MLPWVLGGTVLALCLSSRVADHGAQRSGRQRHGPQSFAVETAAADHRRPAGGRRRARGRPVAFVGLATPHIVRLMRPVGPAWSIALNVAMGGLMTVTADLVARSIALPKEIPVGIVTALIGGPIFIYLVQRRTSAFAGKT